MVELKKYTKDISLVKKVKFLNILFIGTKDERKIESNVLNDNKQRNPPFIYMIYLMYSILGILTVNPGAHGATQPNQTQDGSTVMSPCVVGFTIDLVYS